MPSFWADSLGPKDEAGESSFTLLHCTAFATLLSLSDPLVFVADFRKTVGGHDVLLSGEALLAFALASDLYQKLVMVRVEGGRWSRGCTRPRCRGRPSPGKTTPYWDFPW